MNNFPTLDFLNFTVPGQCVYTECNHIEKSMQGAFQQDILTP